MGFIIHKGIHSGIKFANINATWQRKSIIDDAPINLLPFGYIEGYKMAADLLLEQMHPYDPRLELMVYPVFFLYRQYIELLLKRVYGNSHTADEQRNMIKQSGHNIANLFAVNKPRIHQIILENVEWENRKQPDVSAELAALKTNEILKHIEDAMVEIDYYDQNSFAFRYNYNRDLTETLRSPLTVDLEAFRCFAELLNTHFYGEYAT